MIDTSPEQETAKEFVEAPKLQIEQTLPMETQEEIIKEEEKATRIVQVSPSAVLNR